MSTTQSFTRPDVQGWGADLDVKNRPAYPKERTPPRFIHPHWREVEQQPQTVEILVSTERPTITPVFGTSTPPSGLSGQIRRVAFKYTENDLRHWMLLLFADRINMVEGLFQDLSRGYVPNIFAEMGMKAEYKYNKKGFYRKVAITAGVVGVTGFLIMRSLQKRQLKSQDI